MCLEASPRLGVHAPNNVRMGRSQANPFPVWEGTAMTTLQRATFDDLMDTPDDGHLYELVRGEILRLPPPQGVHVQTEFRLARMIERFLAQRAQAFGWDEAQDEDTYERLASLVAGGEGGVRFSAALDEKVLDYFAGSARLVWLLDPRRRIVRVFRPNGTTETVTADDVLSGEEVLPGFAVPVARLFPSPTVDKAKV
jgi:Uma2 family endonuclease